MFVGTSLGLNIRCAAAGGGAPPFATISAPSTATEGDDPTVTATSGNSGLSLKLEDVSTVSPTAVRTGITTPYSTTYPNITPGSRQIRWTNEGDTSQHTETVTINVSAQAATISAPAAAATITVGDLLTFTADGSADGWDANTIKVEFYVNGILRATSNAASGGTWSATWIVPGSVAGSGSIVAKRYWTGLAGETGTVDSSSVSVTFADANPSDYAAVFGAGLLGWHDAATVSLTSTSIDSFTDRSGNSHNFTASGTARPTQTASDSTLSNLATAGFDGSNDVAAASGLTISTPSKSNRIYVAALVKQNAFTSGRNMVADSTSAFCVLQMGTAAGRIQQNNGTARNDNTGISGTGVWGLVEAVFTASTMDCDMSKGRLVAGDVSAGGNGAGTGRKLGTNAAGSTFANFQLREVIHVANPTLKQLCQFRALVETAYGSGVRS